MILREETLNSQSIYHGRIIKVRVDEVLLPNGSTSTREIVEHSGAVAIVAVDEEQNVCLVRQYRKPVEKVLLEIPAGTMDAGETPLDCARRELEEETGLKANNLEEILYYYSAPGFCDEKLHIFLATGLECGKAKPDDDEFLETVRMPLEEAYQAILNGDIIDGKSIIGLQYAFYQSKK